MGQFENEQRTGGQSEADRKPRLIKDPPKKITDRLLGIDCYK